MFVSWPHIEGLSNLVRNFQKLQEATGAIPPVVTYRGKVKLDGTNAAIRISKDGTIQAQSRTQDISRSNDNAGFAAWVEFMTESIKELANYSNAEDVVIFGEWCGNGIQSGCAISQAPGKHFVAYSVVELFNGGPNTIYSDTSDVNQGLLATSGCKWLGWEGPTYTVDFNNPESLQAFSDAVEKEVARIEACDPWVEKEFGIKGVGEGLVYYPVDTNLDYEGVSHLMFKAKGLKHRVKATEKAAPIKTEVLGLDAFIASFVTEARLNQGVSATGTAETKNIGTFLKWFQADVERESQAELEASNLTWKQVQGGVTKAARDWYLKKV